MHQLKHLKCSEFVDMTTLSVDCIVWCVLKDQIIFNGGFYIILFTFCKYIKDVLQYNEIQENATKNRSF